MNDNEQTWRDVVGACDHLKSISEKIINDEPACIVKEEVELVEDASKFLVQHLNPMMAPDEHQTLTRLNMAVDGSDRDYEEILETIDTLHNISMVRAARFVNGDATPLESIGNDVEPIGFQ